jgi:hypothetical protein
VRKGKIPAPEVVAPPVRMSVKMSTKTRIIQPEVRFEFRIPEGVPADQIDVYVWEKLKRICRGLSKNGMVVTPVVPQKYADRVA